MTERHPDLQRFLRGEMDITAFPHHEHVRTGFEMLRCHDFAESAYHFSNTLRVMVSRAGKPQAFHQTLTIAFLSVIAERMAAGEYMDFEAFVRANADLLDKSVLLRWYSPERLATAAARRTFLLPGPAA